MPPRLPVDVLSAVIAALVADGGVGGGHDRDPSLGVAAQRLSAPPLVSTTPFGGEPTCALRQVLECRTVARAWYAAVMDCE
ncbi:hypothetical protein HK405_013658, partial [Cladochytrium tenue]